MSLSITAALPTASHGLTPIEIAATAESLESMRVLIRNQRRIVHIMVCVSSSFSIGLSLLAIFWFAMMKRNYRRDLILLLVVGDVAKNITYLAFSVVSLASGTISSASNYCQASGYLLVVGLLLCGESIILLMSLHMYLQIFPPAHSMLGHDGLCRIRHWVYASRVIVPNIFASLAFSNRPYGYVAQGSFCYLPIRPYWFRLALSWAPRYVVWVFVTWVAFRIYRHVGREFKVFGVDQDRSTSTNMTAQSSVDRHIQTELSRSQAAGGIGGSNERVDDRDIAPDQDIGSVGRLPSVRSSAAPSNITLILYAGRRPSAPVCGTSSGKTINDTLPGTMSSSNLTSRRGSCALRAGIVAKDFVPTYFGPTLHRGSIGPMGSQKSHPSSQVDGPAALNTVDKSRASAHDPANHCASLGDNAAGRALQQRRRAIQRQLLLLFIYPCVYMIMWLIPFINHCTNYTDRYVTHPIFGLWITATFCQTFMGSVDVIVLSWRERPWRYIPGSDDTFFGSFCWWRYCFKSVWRSDRYGHNHSDTSIDFTARVQDESEKRTSSQKGLLSSLKLVLPKSRSSSSAKRPSAERIPSHRRANSGGSAREKVEADLAHERLELEKQERAEKQSKFLEERGASVAEQNATERTKEWFDRRFNEDLLVTSDADLDRGAGHSRDGGQ